LASLLELHFLALLYLILLYVKKWAFNIKIESGTNTKKIVQKIKRNIQRESAKIKNNSLKK
jgi:hypothetical protein